jgi:hypothetical protein
MMKLCALLLVIAPAIAHAEDTFEAKAANAIRVHHIENVVWALTTPCDQGDDTEMRQCRVVRDKRAAELGGALLWVDADKDAFDIAPWDAAKKSMKMSLTACIRCAGVELEGKTWLLVGGAAGPKFEGGKLRPSVLAETSRAFPDEVSAQAFAKHNTEARVQMLVKVAPKAKWADAGKQGVSFEIVAFRVVSPCDGTIVMANIASNAAEPDKKSCDASPGGKPNENAPVADTLSMTAIKDAMKPVVLASTQCFQQFAIAGTAKLKLTVAGDGTVAKYEQQGDFVGTPTGECIDKAVKNVSFPRTKKPSTSFAFPIQLK